MGAHLIMASSIRFNPTSRSPSLTTGSSMSACNRTSSSQNDRPPDFHPISHESPSRANWIRNCNHGPTGLQPIIPIVALPA